MSIAAREVSSRATSSTSLAGIALAMPSDPAKRLRDEFREAVFQLGGDGGGDVARAAGALAVGGDPVLEVGVVVHAELHGDGVDQRLEALGELERHGVVAVARLHRGRDVLPGDDAVAGHHRPPMNWASRATRSPGASGESSSWAMPRTASLTRISMCSPRCGPSQSAASSSGKRPLNPRST